MKPGSSGEHDPSRSQVIVAGAGTGKTHRLVRRWLEIVLGRAPGREIAWSSLV